MDATEVEASTGIESFDACDLGNSRTHVLLSSDLDDELDRLPERYRGPVVLCFLDGLTRDEAARRLGYSLNTLKRRLEAGRELLRERLARRGLTPVAVAAGRRYPMGSNYLSAAAFARHEIALAEPWKLVSELRLGGVRAEVPADDRLMQLFPEENLPVLDALDEKVFVYAGAVHSRVEVAPWAWINAGVMVGFRAPNIDDYARTGVEGAASIVIIQLVGRVVPTKVSWNC